MSPFEIKMPKLGESVEEALIIKWFIKPDDLVKEDDLLVDIATDKVDSEIPSPVTGKVIEIRFGENEKVAVGTVIAVIDTDSDSSSLPVEEKYVQTLPEKENKETVPVVKDESQLESERFYSPLVKAIAKENNISFEALGSIEGSGIGGRVTKDDLLSYIKKSRAVKGSPDVDIKIAAETVISNGDEIIEMDRMRKMISEHMLISQNVSAHVTNFVEADVTELVKWREKHKENFEKRFRTKLTFMPFFVNASIRSIKDFPLINSSVEGTRIIIHHEVNMSFAVALPSGNLIAPVIRNADRYNIGGLASIINELAAKARNNKLSPDDAAGGTFTITNFGTFKNISGTPIINQPQVAILGVGIIQKKPVVLETSAGDVIAIRHMIMLSLSYDHRIIDGALGGAFLRRVADYLEKPDIDSII